MRQQSQVHFPKRFCTAETCSGKRQLRSRPDPFHVVLQYIAVGFEGSLTDEDSRMYCFEDVLFMEFFDCFLGVVSHSPGTSG